MINHPENPAVEITGLTKRYGSLTAVDAIQLTIPRGQVLALLGPNGAGKSTTTEMMLGLNRPDAGRVQVLGTSPQQATRRGLVGAMLQQGALLEGVPVSRLLKMVNAIQADPRPLDDVIERAGIADVLRTPTTKLSGGEKQRVRLALALLPNPELLLLDEPTVGMDVNARRQFWQAMTDLAAHGMTIVFATHYLAEADEFAERVVVLDRGRIIADGTGSEIKRHTGGRTVRFSTTVPSHPWDALPGVSHVQVIGDRVELVSRDSDTVLREIFAADLPVSEIEVSAASLEDAFVELTTHPAN